MIQFNHTKTLPVVAGFLFLLVVGMHPAHGQRNFNAWLSTCSHLIGPTGNPKSLKLAVDQSRGKYPDAPAFDWDVMIDVGDWTASQEPPGHHEGIALAKCLHETLGADRGRFFSVSGNHDGEPKDWTPGEFTRKYVNPLGEEAHSITSHFQQKQRPDAPDFRQLVDYPDTRWDRYLVRSGNVVWIMMGDRNEFDNLALSRGDFSGTFQAGRGSAAGMPKGGYPSGSVTLDTFNWWKKVVEDPAFSKDILITAHHHMPAFTTISTDNGEPGNYHGKSGSVGPHGEMGGQLYWIREYDQDGKEVNQYAQTHPFMNYLKDHPGAIAAWVGGHTHIHNPENSINGRGIHVRKYGVTFISVGALTDSHAGGANQMTRMITFNENSDQGLLNVYIHRSKDGTVKGWVPSATRSFPLGKKFISPASAKHGQGPVSVTAAPEVPSAPADPYKPRYHWNLNHDQTYDFNNDKFIVGDEGSPYGIYEGPEKIQYSADTPTGKGRSLDLQKTKGSIVFKAPYTPEMNWKSATVSIWVKILRDTPIEILSYDSPGKSAKFKLYYDGEAFVWDVGEKKRSRQIKMKMKPEPDWHHLTGVVDGDAQRIRLYIDGLLVAEKKWKAKSLKKDPSYRLVLGPSYDKTSSSFDWLADEIEIHDSANFPGQPNSPSK
jgi:hypothetical protein